MSQSKVSDLTCANSYHDDEIGDLIFFDDSNYEFVGGGDAANGY